MRIALAQLTSSPHKEENLAAARRTIREAGRMGAELVLLPEVFMAFLDPRGPAAAASVAEPLDGPFVTALAEEARNTHAYVGCGLWETAPGEPIRSYNTTILLGPDGSLLLSYRKTHVYDAFGIHESDLIVPGNDGPSVVRTPIGTFGLLVCYELRFPEMARMLALAGAEVILLPAAWVRGDLKEYHWTTLVTARAIENTVFVAAANQVGNISCGRSLIVDPMGVAVAAGAEEEGLIIGNVDLQRIGRVREKLPSLGHRREEIYVQARIPARA